MGEEMILIRQIDRKDKREKSNEREETRTRQKEI